MQPCIPQVKIPNVDVNLFQRHAPHGWVSWICRLVDLTSSSTCSSSVQISSRTESPTVTAWICREDLWSHLLLRGDAMFSRPESECVINIKAWGKNMFNQFPLALSLSCSMKKKNFGFVSCTWSPDSKGLGHSRVATGGPGWAQAHPLSSVAHPMRSW